MNAGYLGYVMGQALIFAVLGYAVGSPAASGSLKLVLRAPLYLLAFLVIWLMLAAEFAVLGELPDPFDGVVQFILALLTGGGICVAALKLKGQPKTQAQG